jgi:methionyl aminopeptidase
VHIIDDQWTVVTDDHRLSSYAEHTVAVTEHGPEVLTRRPDESVAAGAA